MQSPCHFLIVEDNRFDLELTCAWLERRFRGCQFTCLRTPSEARQDFQPGKFTAAFVNLCLQHNRIAGLPVIRDFRHREPDLPIWVVSGHDEERLRQMAVDAGADGFLPKDVDGSEGQVVYNLIRLRQAAQERGRRSVAKSWRTTFWGNVAAVGAVLSGLPMALLALKGVSPEMAEIVNALPIKLLAYSIFAGLILLPLGQSMHGKSGRDQKEAEEHWRIHSKICPGHTGPDETQTKT